MIKIFGLIVLIALAPLAAVAAEPSSGPTMAKGEVLRGRFVQERHLQGFAAPLRSEGRFLLATDRGLIWTTEKPFAVTTIITPAGLAQEVNGSKTLNLPGTKLPFLSRLYHMLAGALTGEWSALDTDFTVKRGGDGRHRTLDLVPRRADDPAMPLRSIAIEGGRFVETVTLTKPDGDIDKLFFTDHALSTAPLAADEAAAFASPAR